MNGATRAFPQNSENFFTCVQCGLDNHAGKSATNFVGPSSRQIATRGATARGAASRLDQKIR
jgi:cytochrome c551/c552